MYIFDFEARETWGGIMTNRKIGYCRVSTDDQSLDLQRDALKVAGCDDIYEEKASGAKADRDVLETTLRALRKGDALVVWKLDRLARSMKQLVTFVDDLHDRGIQFVSLQEKIDTTSAGGELMFHIFAALAQFERGLISERTKAGLASARARGRNGGRRAKMTTKQTRTAKKMLDEMSGAEVAAQFGVSRGTLYRHLGKFKRV